MEGQHLSCNKLVQVLKINNKKTETPHDFSAVLQGFINSGTGLKNMTILPEGNLKATLTLFVGGLPSFQISSLHYLDIF